MSDKGRDDKHREPQTLAEIYEYLAYYTSKYTTPFIFGCLVAGILILFQPLRSMMKNKDNRQIKGE